MENTPQRPSPAWQRGLVDHWFCRWRVCQILAQTQQRAQEAQREALRAYRLGRRLQVCAGVVVTLALVGVGVMIWHGWHESQQLDAATKALHNVLRQHRPDHGRE